jgi:hypothetical protein
MQAYKYYIERYNLGKELSFQEKNNGQYYIQTFENGIISYEIICDKISAVSWFVESTK